MTAAINLILGTLTLHQDASRLVKHVSQNIGEIFAKASNKDIQLRVIDKGRLSSRTGPLSSDYLHMALEDMTGYQQERTKVSNIGLLIADSFDSARSFFGLMFDDMFRPGSSTPGHLTPREGCAVFLEGIQTGRKPHQVLDEAIFTCVHELGHVFNLQHSEKQNYMYRSATGPLLPPSADHFLPDDCRLLAKCSTSCYIWPGGSRFGDLGDLAPSIQSPDNSNAKTLRLRITISQTAFWRFDPVELDVVFDNLGARSVEIPDALDPGYHIFSVWIQEPGGEVRQLRSPRHYCSPRGVVRVEPSKSMARDISIFGQSGGYTFRRAGLHRIWVSFEFSIGRVLRSNVLEVQVLEQQENSRLWQDSAALLANPDAAQLLYYRLPTARRLKMITRLDDFSAAHRKKPVAAMTRYAIGRTLAVAALRSSENSMCVVASDAQRHLKAVLRRNSFGMHRKQKAEVYLRALSMRLK